MNQGSEPSRAILLTSPAPAAIAVVRLTGPLTASFLQRYFSRDAVGGRCVYGMLRDGDDVIDDAVVALLPEGYADLNLHGGPWVVRRALDLATRFGFETVEGPAAPAAAAAVQTNDPIEQAMLASLPRATTPLGLRMLLAQPAAWRQFRADIAGGIISVADRQTAIASIIEDRALYCLLNPPRLAIVGPANAGKSTLANHLFGQQRSITADLPGTTRDWVGETANLDGLPVHLLDTPGLRKTDDPLEAAAIDRSRGEIASADLAILVLDLSRPLAGEQAELRTRFSQALLVLNKTDIAALDVFGAALANSPANASAVRTIANTGEGIGSLRTRIRRFFLGRLPIIENLARWWTSEQREALRGELH